MSISLGVSLAVFLLIAGREWLPSFPKIWQIMVAGALVLLASGEIGLHEALAAVDWNILLYLFAVFSIGRALYDNGLSHRIAEGLISLKSQRRALLAFVGLFAAMSAILTNDAAAIIGTPIALLLARRMGCDATLLLIVLCVTVTVGSMATPVGNPQNLLIAASGGVPAPVLTFFVWLIVPTLLCLGLVFVWLLRALRRQEAGESDPPPFEESSSRLWPLYIAVIILVVLVVGESVLAAINPAWGFPLGLAAAVAALPVYLFSPTRLKTFTRLDWPTLAFFVAMFIVTGALIQSGSLQALLGETLSHMTQPLATAGISFVGSQVVSNVPLVDIYLKLLPRYEVDNLMMLAAVSTLAGNVFIISAASNVIVLQVAERLGGPEITFTRFTRLVLPIGLVTTALTVGWILLLRAL
ncbi:MAG: SLC13 family permease [Pseudomonadota bacterium]